MSDDVIQPATEVLTLTVEADPAAGWTLTHWGEVSGELIQAGSLPLLFIEIAVSLQGSPPHPALALPSAAIDAMVAAESIDHLDSPACRAGRCVTCRANERVGLEAAWPRIINGDQVADVVQDSLLDTADTVEVLVSTRSAWQRFHGCEPDYIENVCHGRCCDAPSRPGGTLVTIHRSEVEAIRARGGEVADGRLITDGTCTFKQDWGGCGLHFTPDKPFGCIASPFTLAPAGRTLVVRNRYRMLRCYEVVAARGGEDTAAYKPAFEAFRTSLDLIFGADAGEWLSTELSFLGDARADGYTGPLTIPMLMPRRSYEILRDNDASKHAGSVTA